MGMKMETMLAYFSHSIAHFSGTFRHLKAFFPILNPSQPFFAKKHVSETFFEKIIAFLESSHFFGFFYIFLIIFLDTLKP